MKHPSSLLLAPLLSTAAILFLAGCQSDKGCSPRPTAEAQPAPAVAAAAAAVAPAPNPALRIIRIKAGSTTPFTDADGNVWEADHGFADGDTAARDENLPIAGTKNPALYRSERYGMTAFSLPLANGKYTVKLHFAETYDAMNAPGLRVFSFNVAGHEFKDLDLFVKSGGLQHAYVESVPVDITGGRLDIKFTAGVENPEINGIEIIPEP